MDLRYHYLFWKAAYYLVEYKHYRIVKLSPDQDEIWLENSRIKEANIVRIVRKDLDWGNWVKRDLELTSVNGEKIKRSLGKRQLHVKNLYISTFPPVDGDPDLFQDPVERGKTIIQPILLHGDESVKVLKNDPLFNGGDWELPPEVLEANVNWIKNMTLTSSNKQLQKERQLFERGKPFFTYFFIAVQVIMFFILEMNGGSKDPQTLIQYGAKYNPLMIEGEWWRLITPIFLHIGLLHLLMNTLALFYLGTAVEKMFGRIRFVLIYMLSGIAGTLASFLFTSNLSAGASGAIFGCFGALLYFGVLHPNVFFRTMGANIIGVILLNLALGFSLPGIDNAGHIGGLIGGFLVAGIVSLPHTFRPVRQILFLLVCILLTGILISRGIGTDTTKWDVDTVNGVAQEKLSNQEWEETEQLLLPVVEEGAPNAQTYFFLSYAEIKQNKLSLAKKHLMAAVDEDYTFHEAHYNLALILIDTGNREEALLHAKKAYELNRQDEKYEKLYKELQQDR
ncbi:rhomboid family intramembrane serine protease [Rossellomorea aquimaris]|uniref:rhomboid family intramembrane serine protease n=1 Tax=Rossellomorea aquimaris TaxID=189382 RepID=UPI001CD48BD4|nr:rhomboid family intramembrane serine protease [Rossellomorea aquimaris]MCA1058066.1 rhomboid family intramembrane serine protease [Rossellomorea aquimaris]